MSESNMPFSFKDILLFPRNTVKIQLKTNLMVSASNIGRKINYFSWVGQIIYLTTAIYWQNLLTFAN